MTESVFTRRPIRCVARELLAAAADDSAFLQYIKPLAVTPYSAVLLSGGALDCSRYSIAAADPFLVFRSKGREVLVETGAGDVTLSGDPLEILDRLCATFEPDFPLDGMAFAGGAVGYLAYDLKNQIEVLPQTARDEVQLPDIMMFWPSTVFVHDRVSGSLIRLDLACGSDMAAPKFREANASPPWDHELSLRHGGGLRSNFSRDAYLEAVTDVRRYIRNGDVYQVNLSQRFEFPFDGDSFELWRSLFAMNPAPFFAYVQAGDHQVLSTSMERFLYRQGAYVETRPIKGTRKRGDNPEEDRKMRQELENSPKDDAELSMIVDLLRNDLGRVARPRSIRVTQHKRLEAYQNVYHLVSIVTGALDARVRHTDLIRATFPGGSITGCPKIRAMEIIDELEPNVRHVYTGSIGYLGWHDNLDLNIAIRTALIHGGRCLFSVGGGIVYDSDPEDEYEETLHKGRTIFQWFDNAQGRRS